MSILQHSIPITYHKGQHDGFAVGYEPQRGLRKSQSVGGLVNPLLKLARDPKGALETLLSLPNGFDGSFEEEKEQVDVAVEMEGKRQLLYLRLKDAKTYIDWRSAAKDLDHIEGKDAWKEEDESAEYDFALIRTRLQNLDDARLSCDLRRMLFVIRTSLRRSLGNMGELRLYKHSHVGTKLLIERYIESAQETIQGILKLSTQQGEDGAIDSRYLLDQMLQARQSFGRSALLLSGGGTFGMNHIGVVKCLWENKMLPRIVSGASAGSIVAAVLCARTDEEMPEVMADFCYGELDVFEEEGKEESVLGKLARFLKHGSIFEIKNLVRVMRGLLGDLTFQEAYNRTRRILNIPVSSAGLYELPRLLNYITAPNVMIWSAVAASCSVPIIFSAASLLAKDPKTGEETPWNPSTHQWIDGSVDNDLPMSRLSEMFNVNHFIVSQVNPHVVPFIMKEEDSVRSSANDSEPGFSTAAPSATGWLNTLSHLAKDEALHRMHMLTELGVFPNVLTKVRSVLSQRYSGDINIFPEVSYSQFHRVLTNPTTDFMVNAMTAGEKATWPKMSRIQNHCAIELALDDAVRELRARVAFSPSQVNLRQSLRGSLKMPNHKRQMSQESIRGRKVGLARGMSFQAIPTARQANVRDRGATTATVDPLQAHMQDVTLSSKHKSPTRHRANQAARRGGSGGRLAALGKTSALMTDNGAHDTDGPHHDVNLPTLALTHATTNEDDGEQDSDVDDGDIEPFPDASPRMLFGSAPTSPMASRRRSSFGFGSPEITMTKGVRKAHRSEE